jgi:hypothetical protein
VQGLPDDTVLAVNYWYNQVYNLSIFFITLGISQSKPHTRKTWTSPK